MDGGVTLFLINVSNIPQFFFHLLDCRFKVNSPSSLQVSEVRWHCCPALTHRHCLYAFHIGYTQCWYIQSHKFNGHHKTVPLPNVYIYTVINIFTQMIFLSRQMQSKPEGFAVRISGAYSLDLSWMEDKTSSPAKNASVHASLLKRAGLSLGITTCARSAVICEISCATHTKMKVLTAMLSVGFPGMSTRMPRVSAASHMWYWQMNS